MCSLKNRIIKFFLLLGESYYPGFHITDFSSASSSLLLEPSSVFFLIQLLYSSARWSLFGAFLYFLFTEVLAVFIQVASSVNIFKTITLISFLGKLPPFHNGSFSGILPWSFIWNTLFISLDSVLFLSTDETTLSKSWNGFMEMNPVVQTSSGSVVMWTFGVWAAWIYSRQLPVAERVPSPASVPEEGISVCS